MLLHDCHCWLQIVVSFRGTESEFLKDIITDIRIIKQELPPPEDTNDVDIEIDGSVRVHRGFLAALRSVAPKVKEILAHAIPQEQDSGWTVSVTGHSLGAALATLFAYDLKTDPDWCAASWVACRQRLGFADKTRQSGRRLLMFVACAAQSTQSCAAFEGTCSGMYAVTQLSQCQACIVHAVRSQCACCRRNRVEVNAMTFASPRVGNEVFSSAFNQLVGNSWRVFNDDDLVPMIPFWFGYNHVHNGVMVLPKDSEQEVAGMQKPLLAMLNSRAIDISGLAPKSGSANDEQVWPDPVNLPSNSDEAEKLACRHSWKGKCEVRMLS